MATEVDDVIYKINFDETHFVKSGSSFVIKFWCQRTFDGDSYYSKRGIQGSTGENPANEDKGIFSTQDSGESSYSTYFDYGNLPGVTYALA